MFVIQNNKAQTKFTKNQTIYYATSTSLNSQGHASSDTQKPRLLRSQKCRPIIINLRGYFRFIHVTECSRYIIKHFLRISDISYVLDIFGYLFFIRYVGRVLVMLLHSLQFLLSSAVLNVVPGSQLELYHNSGYLSLSLFASLGFKEVFK